MEEPQVQRDRRVEELWRKLDPAGAGELDFKGLQKGLRRIDHRTRRALLCFDAMGKKVWLRETGLC